MDDKAPTLHLTLPEVVAMRHCLCVVIENAVPVLSEFDEEDMDYFGFLVNARQKLNHALWPIDKVTPNQDLLEGYYDDEEEEDA